MPITPIKLEIAKDLLIQSIVEKDKKTLNAFQDMDA